MVKIHNHFTHLRQTVKLSLYDFRPDLSNPPPASGVTYTPSLVTQDFAARCGTTYSIILIGRDSGDPAEYVLGSTSQFTCPSQAP